MLRPHRVCYFNFYVGSPDGYSGFSEGPISPLQECQRTVNPQRFPVEEAYRAPCPIARGRESHVRDHSQKIIIRI